MTTLKRTTVDDTDFLLLIELLDQEMALRDGKQHSFYSQFNNLDKIKNVVVYYEGKQAAGCGSFKAFNSHTIEIKRMFVHENFRRKGVGALILKELESWAAELNYAESILETGKKQPEAIQLYRKSGYTLIPNYEQYKNVENSLCMKKAFQQAY